MYRLFIADDEPKIRRGLKSLKWETLGAQVIGEAANGLEAYEKIEDCQPDIMLVDINMPKLNGLELIKKIKLTLPKCLIIIVSGYDEFEYAKEAVKLNVFDYILKPVNRKELLSTVARAIKVIQEKSQEERFTKWAITQVTSESLSLKRQFIKKWIDGRLDSQEIQDNLDVFKINTLTSSGIMVIKKLELESAGKPKLEKELFNFCILNIVEEIIEPFTKNLTFTYKEDYYGAIINHINNEVQIYLENKIKLMVSQYLKKEVLVTYTALEDILNMPTSFKSLVKKLNHQSKLTPIVLLAKIFVEKNYMNNELSLANVAKHTGVSTAYLSRLIKKEIGMSFTNFLIKVRIQKALELMNNPTLKIFEISDKVGYSSQHYFSAAFKKVIGVSPNSYRIKKEGTINDIPKP